MNQQADLEPDCNDGCFQKAKSKAGSHPENHLTVWPILFLGDEAGQTFEDGC